MGLQPDLQLRFSRLPKDIRKTLRAFTTAFDHYQSLGALEDSVWYSKTGEHLLDRYADRIYQLEDKLNKFDKRLKYELFHYFF